MAKHLRSAEEKRVILDKINKQVSDGITVHKAIKSQGIGIASYYDWSKKSNTTPKQKQTRNRKPTVTTFSVPNSDSKSIVVIVANISQLKQVLSEVTRG